MLRVPFSNPEIKDGVEGGAYRIYSQYSSLGLRLFSTILFGAMGLGGIYMAFQLDFSFFVIAISLFMASMSFFILFVPIWSILIYPDRQELVIQKRSIQNLFRMEKQVHGFDEINSIEKESDSLGLGSGITLRGPRLNLIFTFTQKNIKNAPDFLDFIEETFQGSLTENQPVDEDVKDEIKFSWWRFRLATLFSLGTGLIFTLIWAVGEIFLGVDISYFLVFLGALVGFVIRYASGGVIDNRYIFLALFMTVIGFGLLAVYLFYTPSSPYISSGFIFPFVLPAVISLVLAWTIVRREVPFSVKQSRIINQDNQLVWSLAASFLILVLVFGFYAMTDFAAPEDISAKQAFDNGIILRSQDDPEGAIDAFEDALAKKPDYVEAQVQIGLAYIVLEQFSKAETSLQDALELDPNNGLAYFGLGLIAGQSQNPSDAVEYFTQAFDFGIPPVEESLGLALRGLNYVALNEQELAFADFDQAVDLAKELDEDDLRSRTLFFRALGHLTFGQIGRGVVDLNMALEFAVDEALISEINRLLNEFGDNS